MDFIYEVEYLVIGYDQPHVTIGFFKSLESGIEESKKYVEKNFPGIKLGDFEEVFEELQVAYLGGGSWYDRPDRIYISRHQLKD